ncbi:MAG TPA: glycosyltransferase family 1 protein [Chloroflexi bacterium]|jgi:glycosyltransferase involved in cell wall biosynthesis|nr:glycosyltransferase family 1 protein [Chloroflexota bacterium]
MALTVGFDATSAVRQTAGIGRYTRELLWALSGRDDDIRYRIFYCSGGDPPGGLPPLDERFRMRSLPVSDRITNALWHRLRLPVPVQLITGNFDIFHSPDFTLPPTMGRPSIVTVHDLAFLTVPQCAYPTLRDYLEAVVPRSVRRASRVIAVSQSTARDLVERLGTDPARIEVIHEGVSSWLRPGTPGDDSKALSHELVGEEPYILSVGTLEPRKNYVRLLEAFAILRARGYEHRLVIAGRKGWLYQPIFERVHELDLVGKVLFVEPGDPELLALYRAADAFVYPSLYEGFGIPPLEALACGIPVACASTSSLPEIVGDAALLFDPEDVEAMAFSIERVLSDANLAQTLREAGPNRARNFSWADAARATEGLYREVAGA